MKYPREAVESVLHLFYPETCLGCGGDLPRKQHLICFHCNLHMPVTGFEWQTHNPVEKIFWGRAHVNAASAHYFFTKQSPLQHILHEFKYGGKKEVGAFLGKKMGIALRDSLRFDQVDLLIPLPLYWSRQKERGYNQATVISQGISEIMGLPVIEDVLTRVNATETQTHKSRVERWQNIEGKFQIENPGLISHKHLLVVDDVVTTGATLDACVQELNKVPGVSVSIATLACTIG